jgi:peroxiredoxin
MLILSVSLNVLLARKVHDVTEVSRLLKLKMDLPILVPGAKAPEFSANDLTGKRTFLNYADVEVPTVLYVFSPQCHWCSRNLENIQYLAGNTSGRFRFVGVSLTNTDLPNYLAHNKFPFQIYQSPSDDVKIAYGFNSTPSTIVVSPSGKVVQYWRGAYSEDLQTEIEGFFQVKLPGLANE